MRAYGEPGANAFAMLIDESILADDFKYPQTFATFDVETLDSHPVDDIDEAVELKLVSIATGSNIEGDKPKFFLRKDSSCQAAQEMVTEMMLHLTELAKKRISSLPESLHEAHAEFVQLQAKLYSEFY